MWKLAKEQRLGGCRVGRLTENKCDSLQNFYRGAILDNLPNVNKTKSVWAGLWHSINPCLRMRNHTIISARRDPTAGAFTRKP